MVLFIIYNMEFTTTEKVLFIIAALLIIFGLLSNLYIDLLRKRNWKVWSIRNKWLNERDYEKLDKYSYDSMVADGKDNWFGLKPLKEEDYK